MAVKPNGNGGLQITWINLIATMALLATVSGGAWLLFQQQFKSLEEQFGQAARNLQADIKDNRTELERLRSLSISREEHAEFVKRLDGDLVGLGKRLDVIEATRPTTGELKSVADGMQVQANEIKQRLQFLEQSHPYPP